MLNPALHNAEHTVPRLVHVPGGLRSTIAVHLMAETGQAREEIPRIARGAGISIDEPFSGKRKKS